MKGYLLKTIGILVIATLAGVAHFALGKEIRFAKDLGPTNNTIGEPRATNNDDPATPDADEPAQTTEEPQAGTDAGEQPFQLTEAEKHLDREITLRQARYLFENDMAIFIDARPSGEFEKGHIAGAFSVPTNSFENGPPVAAQILDDQRYVVIYCSGGNCEESHLVAEDLALERPDLMNMIHICVDGYPAWTEAGLPTQDGPDPFAE